MFTGLIEEIGTIKSITAQGRGRKITVSADKIMDDLKIDDSVAINGACQTVVKLTDNTFEVDTVEETLRKSTLGTFTAGQKVNLERAMELGGRMGGHLVQGHVDCVGHVLNIIPESTGKQIWINFPKEFKKYIVPVGSICINGVSLTVAKVEGEKFMVAVIPHTWDVTLLSELKSGSQVNLEFDIIGKYIENMLKSKNEDGQEASVIDKYIKMGF